MRAVLECSIINHTSSDVGPFDATHIFGAYKRDTDQIYVKASETAKFKTTLDNSFETVASRFSERLAQLGLANNDVSYALLTLPEPHEDDLAMLKEVRKAYAQPPPDTVMIRDPVTGELTMPTPPTPPPPLPAPAPKQPTPAPIDPLPVDKPSSG